MPLLKNITLHPEFHPDSFYNFVHLIIVTLSSPIPYPITNIHQVIKI